MVVTAVNPKHYPRHPRLEMQQKFPELLTMSGAHYVTRTVTSKAFVRVTRPLSQKLAYSSPLEEFNRYQGKKVRNVWPDKCAPHRGRDYSNPLLQENTGVVPLSCNASGTHFATTVFRLKQVLQ